MCEVSALRIVEKKYKYPNDPTVYSEVEAREFGIIDIGINLFDKENLAIGIVPYSWDTSASGPGDGLAILAKYKIKNIVFEGKIIPIVYHPKQYPFPFYNDNSYIGASYFINNHISAGIRHNREGDVFTTSVTVSYNFGK